MCLATTPYKICSIHHDTKFLLLFLLLMYKWFVNRIIFIEGRIVWKFLSRWSPLKNANRLCRADEIVVVTKHLTWHTIIFQEPVFSFKSVMLGLSNSYFEGRRYGLFCNKWCGVFIVFAKTRIAEWKTRCIEGKRTRSQIRVLCACAWTSFREDSSRGSLLAFEAGLFAAAILFNRAAHLLL